MKIKGVGVLKKEEAMSILTREGKEAIKSGDITEKELGEMYKLELVKKSSKIGKFPDSFRESYKWIPDDLKEILSPEQLGNLTDQFYYCYGSGKNNR